VGLVVGSAYAQYVAREVLNVTVFFLVVVVCLVIIKRLFFKYVLKLRKHPIRDWSSSRFCHICGADADKREPCNTSLHS